MDVVEPKEQPNEIMPKKIVGTIHSSWTSADHPKPINPMHVVIKIGRAMMSLNSGSYRPPFRRAIERTKISLILPATPVPRTAPVKGARYTRPVWMAVKLYL